MNELEKVEALRERTSVSYEEARQALAQCNGDLLDAIVMLERQGKTNSQKQAFEGPSVYIGNEQKTEKRSVWKKFKQLCSNLWKKGNDNYFCVTKEDEIAFKVPAWVFVLFILFTWELSLIVMLIGLFVGYKFTFIGKDDLRTANHVFDRASDLIYQVKEELK